METLAARTIAVYRTLGILENCVKLGSRMNHAKKVWEVNALFRDANGYRNGKVAEFDDVADAVEFERLAGF